MRRAPTCLAALTLAGLVAIAAATPGAARTQASKFAIYDVKFGLTGQASQHENEPCQGSNPCSGAFTMTGNATYHVDLTYKNALFQTGGRRVPVPKSAGTTRPMVVNGSFTATGTEDPNSDGSSTPYSCQGALHETAPDKDGEQTISWKRHGSNYSFVAESIKYGLDGGHNGSGYCANTWFGDGGLSSTTHVFEAEFKIPVSYFGHKKTFTKTTGGPLPRWRPPNCTPQTQGGTCQFTAGWHAVLKFKRVR